MGWTAKREAFVEEYLRCWNATEAARRVGYKHPTPYGAFLRNLNIVQDRIQARIAEKAMDADEVLLRLAEQARGDHAAYLNPNGTVDLVALIHDGKAHLVKGTRWDSQGNLVVEFYDGQAALVHIGKHLGLFKDQIEHSGPGGKALLIEYINDWRTRGSE